MGTALTVRQMVYTLRLVDPAPRVLGCLLPKAAAGAGVDLPVVGTFERLEATATKPQVEQVLVSLPAVMHAEVRAAAATLDRRGVRWRFMPTLADQLAGHSTPRHAGRIDPAELIDRRPRPLDDAAIGACLTGKTVLITGAGGSIGGELARTVAPFTPGKLVLVERAENALFEVDRQLGRLHPELPRRAVLHDVTRRDRTLDLMREVRPEVVFHAAAHKHVPMMEGHPAEAVENNLYGTRSIADAADAAGCERFVMISTDKAVNPSSVMGATKRLAEMYVRHLGRTSATRFCMVRFGNVLGSACSLIPIWTDQLAHGGPLTVTHAEMTRYFMTIPEAAGLVLQAGAYAGRHSHSHSNSNSDSAWRREPSSSLSSSASASGGEAGGEVFLLDMGGPIRILELAERFLRLQGFEPNVDIPIRITGPRPGEKLFEELAYGSEELIPTPHPSIRRWRCDPPDPAQMQQILRTFDRLRDKSADGSRRWRDADPAAVVRALRAALPEMVTALAG